MGEPEYLSLVQTKQLETASLLRPEGQAWKREPGAVHFCTALPPQSVASMTFEFDR